MKKQIIQLFGCVMVLLSTVLQSQNTDDQNFDISTLALPKFEGYQNIKGLITISPYNSEVALTRTDSGLMLEKVDIAQHNENQLWWVVQDYIHSSFALVDVKDGSKWLAIEKDTVTNSNRLVLTTNNAKDSISSLYNTEYIDDKYFFEFQKPNSVTTEKTTLLRSYQDKEVYLTINNKPNESSENWQIVPTTLQSDFVADNFVFTYKKLRSFEDNYISVPVYDSALHQETVAHDNSKTTITSTLNYPIENNKAILASGNIIILNKNGDDKLFKTTFTQGSVAEIGLMSYQHVAYAKEAIQAKGSRKAVAGIGIDEVGIYMFNKARVEYVSEIVELEGGKKVNRTFQPDKPIYFGYTKGTLVAKQDELVKRLTGVATPALLNNSFGSYGRLLATVREGSVDLAYRPQAAIINKDFGTKTMLPELYSTDPLFSFVPSNSKIQPNTFDWRQETFLLKEKTSEGGSSVEKHTTQSPFYSNKPDMASIAYKNSASGTYKGGEDYSNLDGWELIKSHFTDTNENAVKENNMAVPYIILYNRFLGKLRVFTYIKNGSIANNLAIKLVSKYNNSNSITGKYANPRIWSTYLQSVALNDQTLRVPEYSKLLKLESNENNRFYYADFMLNYDPCVCFFESNLQVIVNKVTKGDMKITGRTIGGTIPENSPAVKDGILSDPKKYLTGVLDGPPNTNTLGDISFKHFDEWGKQDWPNKTEFVIPGKKVEPWQRQALLQKWAGTSTMAAGDFTSAAGKLLKAAGKASQTFNPFSFFGVEPGKAAEAAGESIDAIGTAIKGAGRATFADSFRIEYQNLKDEPDKTIPLTFPPAQPSVLFSELAATGTVTFETTMSDDIFITTPGSLKAEEAPEEYRNKSKGSRPVYNEPLGVFSLLYKPAVGIYVGKDANGNVTGSLHLKEQPYISFNNKGTRGIENATFLVNFILTIHNGNYPLISVGTKPHRMLVNVPFEKSIDITSVIQDMSYYSKVNSSTNMFYGVSEEEISDMIKNGNITVDLEVNYYGSTGKTATGNTGADYLKQSFHADVELLNTPNNSNYQAVDNSNWGKNYVITNGVGNLTTADYNNKMETYCLQTNKEIRTVPVGRMTNTDKTTRKVVEVDKVAATKTVVASEKVTVAEAFNVYPNPSNRIFNINYKAKAAGEIKMQVVDISGSVLLSHKDVANEVGEQKQATINLQSLTGVYVLKIQFTNGESLETKLIKK